MKKSSKTDLASKIMAYGATAAGLLAVAQPASAAIVHSGAQNLPLSFPGNTPQNIDLNNDGNDDFFFSATSYYSGDWHNINTINSNQFIQSDGARSGPTVGHSDAANLPLNYIIQTTLIGTLSNTYWGPFSNEPVAGPYSSIGSFNDATGYLGVRFHSVACAGADWHYGWIQFSNNGVNDSTIIDWAYESTCNTQIPAGATGTAAATIQPVPTISELGMLAMAGLLGGAAVNHLRRRKKENK